MNSRAQVSLESLLIWAALAAALALFTPAFAHLIGAYGLQQQTLELKSHAQQLESIFSELSFQSSGSKIAYAWQSPASLQVFAATDELEFRLVDVSLQNPKSFFVHSPIPIAASISLPFSSLSIARSESGITIQSQ